MCCDTLCQGADGSSNGVHLIAASRLSSDRRARTHDDASQYKGPEMAAALGRAASNRPFEGLDPGIFRDFSIQITQITPSLASSRHHTQRQPRCRPITRSRLRVRSSCISIMWVERTKSYQQVSPFGRVAWPSLGLVPLM